MVDFTLTEEQHDRTICAEIGKAAKQVDGDWEILHRRTADGKGEIISLPTGSITKAGIQSVLDAHIPDAQQVPEVHPDITILQDTLNNPLATEFEQTLARVMLRNMGV